jgi:hypothetical protein
MLADLGSKMPLTGKGEKIKAAMTKQYGPEKGEQVFYASKNKGKITGVDDDYEPLEKGKSRETVKKNIGTLLKAGHEREAAVGIAMKKARGDDNQHLGFTGNQALAVEELATECDALSKRLDAFENWQHQRKPKDVKPRTKDNMQPSNRHPKEVG